MCRGNFTAQQFNLSGDPQRRPFECGLSIEDITCQKPFHFMRLEPDVSERRCGRAMTTNLESVEFESIGKGREGLVTGTGLCNQSQGAGRARNFSVGDLDASRLEDIVLEAGSHSRGHAATAAGTGSRERTGRISAEGRPRQHYCMCGISNEERGDVESR